MNIKIRRGDDLGDDLVAYRRAQAEAYLARHADRLRREHWARKASGE